MSLNAIATEMREGDKKERDGRELASKQSNNNNNNRVNEREGESKRKRK